MKKVILGLALFAHAVIGVEEPELIGGTVVDSKDFPASVYASMNNARCSATVIGPRTLLIAAHCVSNGGTASFKANGTSYSSKCTHAREYSGNSTADWALCLVDKTVAGIVFESLETSDAPLKRGDEALLTGHGCINPGGGGGNDGPLRIGHAIVQDVPSGGSSNDVVTQGKAALCFGDSGGGFYCAEPGSLTKRKVCGVNSRGNISDTSYLSAVFTAMAKGFIQDWKSKNSQKICGYDMDPSCRGSAPQVPIEFKLESADLVLSVVIQVGAPFSEQDAKTALQSALNSLEGA